MRAVVLAAGWGTRLGALAGPRSKALLPVAGRAPLDFVLDALERLRPRPAVDVVTNERFRPELEAWARRRPAGAGLRVLGNATVRLEERRGAVGDLHRYLECERPAGPLLVLGADMVFDGSLQALAEGEHDDLAICVHDVGSAERVRALASVELAADGTVRRFVEKDPEPSTTFAAPAIYRLPSNALSALESYREEGGSPDNLGHLVAWWLARRRVRGVVLSGRWIDVGTPDEYARACREFATPRTPGPPPDGL